MAEQKGPHGKDPAPEIAKKLDGNLRRLLRMSDGEILEALDRERARLAEKRLQIDYCFHFEFS